MWGTAIHEHSILLHLFRPFACQQSFIICFNKIKGNLVYENETLVNVMYLLFNILLTLSRLSEKQNNIFFIFKSSVKLEMTFRSQVKVLSFCN